MRILHVTDGYGPRLGGIETQVHDLAHLQAAGGHDVEVVTSVASPLADDGPVVVHRPRWSGAAPGAIQWDHTSAGLRRALEGDFDVVHAHVSIASPLAISALRRCAHAGIPVVATVHSIWGRTAATVAAVATPSRGGRSAVAWSAVSSVAAAPIRALGAFDVRVVPNGIDAQWWRARPDAATATPANRVHVLTTMRLARRKRPLPLLRMIRAANRQAAASGGGLDLTVVGDGPLTDAVAREIERTSMGQVTLAGRLTRAQLRDRMAEHDLYIAPARLESFGIAALEARCAGLPVVAHRQSGIRDFIADGWDGLLSVSDDAMTDVLGQLAADRVRVGQLRRHAQSCLPDLGWDRTTNGYAQLYAEAHERTVSRARARTAARHAPGAGS